MYYFRDLLVLKLAGGSATERIVDAEKFRAMAEAYAPEKLFKMIETLNHYQQEMKHAAQPQTLLEVALLKLCADSGGSHAVHSDVSSQEISELRQQVKQLEGQIARLMKQGVTASPSAQQAERQPARRSFVGGSNRPKVKLDRFIAAKHNQETQEARMKWGDIMMRVKERKVTVQAWLKDSELVAAVDGQLLLTFRNDMHREMTERPSHRELIEQVAGEVMNRPYQLVTAMLRDWQNATDGNHGSVAESLELEPEDVSGQKEEDKQPEWIEEAVKLFGEELVVVKE